MSQVAIADSNIALLGTDRELEVRKAAADFEKEFDNAGTKPGVEIWRIEKLGVKKQPQSNYGNFFNGDSYIVLHTYQEKDSETLRFNLHFWLGETTTQDEAGVAAYKTVELDDKLGTLPVQYREVSGHESSEFLDLFQEKFIVMEGGIESGFNHVKPEEYTPRLLHVKGTRKYIRLSQVPLARDSLNDGDVFVLDSGLHIYQWNGTQSGVYEKRRANEIVQSIKEERMGRPKSEVLDGMEECDEFWNLLGGMGQIKTAEEGGDDSMVPTARPKQLWQLSDASGTMEFSSIAEGNQVKPDKLNDDDDAGHMIFVWIGKGASPEEKAKAFQYANDYIEKNGLALSIPVSRVVQGATSSAFDTAIGAF